MFSDSYSFKQYFMCTYYASYNILGAGNIAMHKTVWILGTDNQENCKRKFSTILEEFLTLL